MQTTLARVPAHILIGVEKADVDEKSGGVQTRSASKKGMGRFKFQHTSSSRILI
jgi:hypothetical protein